MKRFERNRRVRSLLSEVSHAPDDSSWLAGAFLELKSRLLEELHRHARATLPVADAPTVEILGQLSAEMERQVGWCRSALASRDLTEIERQPVAEWRRHPHPAMAGGLIPAD